MSHRVQPWQRSRAAAPATFSSKAVRAFNGQLAGAGLIDEVCLTLAPCLVSGDAARILDGPAIEPALDLALVHVLEADRYLFFRYARK